VLTPAAAFAAAPAMLLLPLAPEARYGDQRREGHQGVPMMLLLCTLLLFAALKSIVFVTTQGWLRASEGGGSSGRVGGEHPTDEIDRLRRDGGPGADFEVGAVAQDPQEEVLLCGAPEGHVACTVISRKRRSSFGQDVRRALAR